MFAMGHLIKKYCLLAVLTINLVSARFCENGNHRCLPPKECCAQGCCYLYSPPKSAPKTPPVNDNVLNLFFISHWYFWCFLFAVVLALLLFCSLWKKRRQFCTGWGSSSNHHSQSEGDSAGSCYAPPHYSRCSSFHHAPPPYTEVTSKPDLYPLVFSYTNDNSKNGNNGANYLMVQYFRNYIVRPIGSLSASNNSTVDSLSSSFICTANEANTLIPPPYSSAASPDDLSMSLQNYAIPRSASQQAYMNDAANILIENQHLSGNSSTYNRPNSVPNTNQNPSLNSNLQFRVSESANFTHLFPPNDATNNCILIHQNHQMPSSSTSTMTTTHTASSRSRNHNINISDDDDYSMTNNINDNGLHYNESIIQLDAMQSTSNNNNNNCGLHLNSNNISSNNNSQKIPHHYENSTVSNTSSSSTANNNIMLNYLDDNTAKSIYHSNDTMLSLSSAMPAAMMDQISYSRKTKDCTKLNLIQKQLEKCCEMIQQQQQQLQQTQHFKTTTPCSTSFDSASESPISHSKKMSDTGIMGLSYMSNTGSTVSSLANLNSPGSPPRATSPTLEVKELLEQIRQLKNANFSDDDIQLTDTYIGKVVTPEEKPQHHTIDMEYQPVPGTSSDMTTSSLRTALKRPTSLNNKRKFFNMKNRSVYLPISNNSTYTTSPNGTSFASSINNNIKSLRSPIAGSGGAMSFMGKTRRNRTGWISKSAPTTPGSMPVNFMSDDSPLLNEQDEEAETEQN